MGYLTERERYNIEFMLKEKYSTRQIAEKIGKSVRTIQYEIKRGTVEQLNSDLTERHVYLADYAQARYEENKKNKGKNLKIGSDLAFVRFVEHWIGEKKYSPYAVLQKIRNEKLKFRTEIGITTLYSYIDKGIFLNITNRDLPMKRERKKRGYKKTVSLNNTKGTSIEKRPAEINDRQQYGHWEMDTVVGGQGKGKSCLLVFSERASREEIIIKIPDRKAMSVVRVLNALERRLGAPQFRATFRSITCDNGVEFLDFEGMENSCINKKIPRTRLYYCHPYSSWERGTNENTNRLIRRFIPKGSNIDLVTEEQIRYIEKWINSYPRKILDGMSSEMKKEKTAS